MPETHIASGKIREIYAIDDERLLLVASDRISTFDVVLPTEIPDKGRVLTGLSGYWFTVLDPVPEYWGDDWYDTDYCTVVSSEDGYYLVDEAYPDVQLAVSIRL